MKYYVYIINRDQRYKIFDRRWLIAKNKKEALKEAQGIADEFNGKNITVMLYKHGETDELIKDFREYKPISVF